MIQISTYVLLEKGQELCKIFENKDKYANVSSEMFVQIGAKWVIYISVCNFCLLKRFTHSLYVRKYLYVRTNITYHN